MWYTYFDPPFVLAPKHAAVFRLAAVTLSDFIGWESEEDDWAEMGVSVFTTFHSTKNRFYLAGIKRFRTSAYR